MNVENKVVKFEDVLLANVLNAIIRVANCCWRAVTLNTVAEVRDDTWACNAVILVTVPLSNEFNADCSAERPVLVELVRLDTNC